MGRRRFGSRGCEGEIDDVAGLPDEIEVAVVALFPGLGLATHTHELEGQDGMVGEFEVELETGVGSEHATNALGGIPAAKLRTSADDAHLLAGPRDDDAQLLHAHSIVTLRGAKQKELGAHRRNGQGARIHGVVGERALEGAHATEIETRAPRLVTQIDGNQSCPSLVHSQVGEVLVIDVDGAVSALTQHRVALAQGKHGANELGVGCLALEGHVRAILSLARPGHAHLGTVVEAGHPASAEHEGEKSADARRIAGDDGNLQLLLQLEEVDNIDGGSRNGSEFLTDLASEVGNDVRTIGNMSATQSAVLEDLDATYQSLFGVDLDEKAANLVHYQATYQASAKVITTADEMLQSLLSLV